MPTWGGIAQELQELVLAEQATGPPLNPATPSSHGQVRHKHLAESSALALESPQESQGAASRRSDRIPVDWSTCCASPMPQTGEGGQHNMKRRRHTPEQII